MLTTNDAVPVDVAVPDTVYTNAPLPLFRVPELRCILSPVTPVEEIDCEE
jgi:hypothetical protein